MPTTYTDQFWLIDPSAPPPVGTVLDVFVFDIIDQNDNDLINRFSDDSIDGVDITASYPGDTVTVTLSGGGNVTIEGTTFYLADGRVVFTPSDGSVLQTATLVDTTFVTTQGSMPVGSLGPPCFVAGTQIETPCGMKPVETLRDGDTVIGFSGQELTLSKVFRRQFMLRDLTANPKLRPICITAGALGNNLPRRDLHVSRQHRMLLSSKIAERMFGQSEVLIPAIKQIDMPGIYIDEDVESVTYFHLLFDQHEVIYAEGAPTESLFTGPIALEAISPDAKAEILTIFPEVADLDYVPEPARFIPPAKQIKRLIARHSKNNQPLVRTDSPQARS